MTGREKKNSNIEREVGGDKEQDSTEHEVKRISLK